MANYQCARQKTRERIKSAFWELYKTSRIEKITVKDIAEKSGIHRATFYLHFSDVYAILEEIEEGLLEELKSVRNEQIDSVEDLRRFTADTYTLYQKNREYLHYLLHEQRDSCFLSRYKNEMVTMLQHICRVNPDELDVKARAVMKMTFDGMVDMYITWSDEPQFSNEDMVEVVQGYLCDGIVDTLWRVYKIPLFTMRVPDGSSE